MIGWPSQSPSWIRGAPSTSPFAVENTVVALPASIAGDPAARWKFLAVAST
jgi:hypothetical protein